jgi:ABC-type branched-subunit amino acid transport system ATPase component
MKVTERVLAGEHATADALLEADFAVARRAFDVVARMSLTPGQRLSLFGASGAGKTTILEAIAGTVSVVAGEAASTGGTRRHAPARNRRRTPAHDGVSPSERVAQRRLRPS